MTVSVTTAIKWENSFLMPQIHVQGYCRGISKYHIKDTVIKNDCT